MSPTIELRDGRPFMAVGAAGGRRSSRPSCRILLEQIDRNMSLANAIDAPRASQRIGATTQAEPAFIDGRGAPGLEQLGQTFKVVDTSPLDPTVSIPRTIGQQPVSSSSATAGSPPPARSHAAAVGPDDS
jgi:gamma-glutamyltranspeptidase/glutathione hydrolase